MEDAKRKSKRVLTVERGFEWSRLEGQVMASAYEHIVPAIRAAPRESPAAAANLVGKGRDGAARDSERYARGA
jgi:hypothetical protein